MSLWKVAASTKADIKVHMGDNHPFRTRPQETGNARGESSPDSNKFGGSVTLSAIRQDAAPLPQDRSFQEHNSQILHNQAVAASPVFSLKNSPHISRGSKVPDDHPDRQFLQGYQKLKEMQEKIKKEMRDKMRGQAATGGRMKAGQTPMSRIASSSRFWDNQRQLLIKTTASPRAPAAGYNFLDDNDGYWSGESYDSDSGTDYAAEDLHGFHSDDDLDMELKEDTANPFTATSIDSGASGGTMPQRKSRPVSFTTASQVETTAALDKAAGTPLPTSSRRPVTSLSMSNGTGNENSPPRPNPVPAGRAYTTGNIDNLLDSVNQLLGRTKQHSDTAVSVRAQHSKKAPGMRQQSRSFSRKQPQQARRGAKTARAPPPSGRHATSQAWQSTETTTAAVNSTKQKLRHQTMQRLCEALFTVFVRTSVDKGANARLHSRARQLNLQGFLHMARVLELHKVGVSYNDCKKIFKDIVGKSNDANSGPQRVRNEYLDKRGFREAVGTIVDCVDRRINQQTSRKNKGAKRDALLVFLGYLDRLQQNQNRTASTHGGADQGGQRSRSMADAFRELGPRLQPVLTRAMKDFQKGARSK